MLKIYIKKGQLYSKPLEYIFLILSKNKSIKLIFLEDKRLAQVIFDHTDPSSLPINLDFYDSLLNKKIYKHDVYFKNSPYIYFTNSKNIDWLGSAFYMINSFQEYDFNENFQENYGRFPYEKSYQEKFKCIDKNLVEEYFNNFINENNIFVKSLDEKRLTRVFLTHDIDTLNGSFLQDGLWALKRGRLDIILKLIMNEILLNPHWKNIDKIANLHTSFDLKSTFFWLATKKISENKIKNADYSIKKLNGLLEISQSNGLHKSCFSTSFKEELDMLPFKTAINRYHFLKFNIKSAWEDIESSNLKLDASLGFAERFGFRNNYGLPFKPFNISNGTSYKFVEVPLNIMDSTFQKYMKIPINKTGDMIIDFLEKNKSNSIISILWHNTFFTDYKYGGYLQEYKKVLLYLAETKMESVTPEDIIKEFAHE